MEDGSPRPNAPDWKTSSELAAEKFSGLRLNQLAQQAEIWVDGEVRASFPPGTSDEAVARKYSEIFALHHSEIPNAQ